MSERVFCGETGDRESVYRALRKIPTGMQAHGKPQTTGKHISGGEEHSGFEGDGYRACDRSAGLKAWPAPKNAEETRMAIHVPPSICTIRKRKPRISVSSTVAASKALNAPAPRPAVVPIACR